MPATLASEFGVGYPIFAFSHCRDVVAEVSRRGGFGVFGAATYTVEELDTELQWIDDHSGGNPYGVDVLMPARTADTGTMDPGKLRDELAALIPEEHRKFVRRVLEENGIPTRPIDAPFKYTGNLLGASAGTLPMIDIILGHPRCRLFVSALGTPRPDVIRRFHDAGVKVGALAGAVQHAVRHVQGGSTSLSRKDRGGRPHRRDLDDGAHSRRRRRGGSGPGAVGRRYRDRTADRRVPGARR